jgi:hypothetical protein
MPSPNVVQGNINRLVSSVTLNDHSELNITPPFMGRPMIRFSRDGQAVAQLPTATGVVNSPEPYMMVTIAIALLKTQSLAARWENQLLTNSILGEITVRPDVSEGIGAFDVTNASLESVGELSFDGSSADYGIVIKGVYPINSGLFP